jgi:two-component system, cell cycle sensor histidine kinase and response regulator CckA
MKRHKDTSGRATRRAGSMPAAGQAYVALVAAAAAAASLPGLFQLRLEARDVLVFGLLGLGAASGSILFVSTERNHGFTTALVFTAAAVMLLPPGLIALVGLAQYGPDLIRRRYPWYTQLFNLANFTLNALAAWGAAHLVEQAMPGRPDVGHAVGAAAACLVLVGSNHVLLVGALRLARARSVRETGLFSWKSLSTDLLLASLGVTIAGVWEWNPYLLPLAIAPFVLISRSFSLLELLQQSERRFRAIYESTAMGIGLIDTSGRVVDHNRAFGEMLGQPDEELAGKELSEFTAGDEASVGDALFDELVGGQRESYALEQRYRRADGEVLWGHLTASVVRDADGNPEFTVGMMHDVSDRKQLEERLYQSEKLDAIGRLAGGVAHDFNNLLTVITAHSSFLLGSLDEREVGQRADVEAIEHAALRAASLTQQLLAFGRKQVLQPRIVDLNTIVVDTNKMLRRLIGDHIEVVTALGSDLGDVQADPGQVEQVLVNLALNARDAMSEGGTLTIRTANADPKQMPTNEAVGPFVVLSVTDSGCGMDSATRGRIFEPFFTTKKAKGTGLGLASVYGIVAQSGGFIDVTSVPDEGTTMAVYLPRVERERDAHGGPAGLPPRETGGETILLAEDEDGVRAAARRILAAQGYTVLEAFDGAEALELAAGHGGAIDLLVTDIVMPRKTGPQVAAVLQAQRPELKVLYVSGYADEAIVPLALAGSDTAFVQKPFTRERLAAAVRELLDRESEPVGRAVGAHPDR